MIRRGAAAFCLMAAVALVGGCGFFAKPAAPHTADTKSPAAKPGEPQLDRVTDLYRLYGRWKSHCDRAFVTPEVTRQYEEAVRQMDEAAYGYGRNSNFAGVKPPRAAWVECAENGG